MIFGNPLSFAVEAVVEPGPEFLPNFGGNVVGRMRVFVGGTSVGNIEEPNCILRALSEDLVELCETDRALWHPSLAGIAPEEQFQLLDAALFLGGGKQDLEACHSMVFLTNVSEAFDLIKGFILSPSPNEIFVLLKLDLGSPLIHRVIPYAEFCSVSASFAHWVSEQERVLLNGAAGEARRLNADR